MMDTEHQRRQRNRPFRAVRRAARTSIARVAAWLARTSLLGAVLLTIFGLLAAGWLVLWLTGLPQGRVGPWDLHPGTLAWKDRLTFAGAVAAATGAVVALVISYRKQRDAEDSRFGAAFAESAAQLSDPSPAVRIAGAYSIAALADRHREHRQQCIDTLCAYLRLPYGPNSHTLTQESVNVGSAIAGQTSIQTLTYHRPEDREVRLTIIRIVRDHLQDPGSSTTWCGCDLDFTGATFDGGSFTGAHITGGQVTFAHARFSSGTLSFTGALFSGGEVDFNRAMFAGGTVSFDGSVFSGGEVKFNNATFWGSGTVSFGGAKFSGALLTFCESRFQGSTVSFDKAIFAGGKVAFQGAVFSKGTVTFQAAAFSGSQVTFSGAVFSGAQVDFNFANFSGGEVIFALLSVFGGHLNFIDSTVSGAKVAFSALASDGRGGLDVKVFPSGSVTCSVSTTPDGGTRFSDPVLGGGGKEDGEPQGGPPSSVSDGAGGGTPEGEGGC